MRTTAIYRFILMNDEKYQCDALERRYDNCMVLPVSGIISPVELCASNISHKYMAIILRKDTPGATQAGSLSPFYVEAEGSSSIHWIKSYFNCSSHILVETKIIKKLQSKKIIYIFVSLKKLY